MTPKAKDFLLHGALVLGIGAIFFVVIFTTTRSLDPDTASTLVIALFMPLFIVVAAIVPTTNVVKNWMQEVTGYVEPKPQRTPAQQTFLRYLTVLCLCLFVAVAWYVYLPPNQNQPALLISIVFGVGGLLWLFFLFGSNGSDRHAALPLAPIVTAFLIPQFHGDLSALGWIFVLGLPSLCAYLANLVGNKIYPPKLHVQPAPAPQPLAPPPQPMKVTPGEVSDTAKRLIDEMKPK